MAFVFLFQSKMLATMKVDIYTYLNKIGGNFWRKTSEKSRPLGRLDHHVGEGPLSAKICGDGGSGLRHGELDREAFLEMPDDGRAQRADIQR